MLCRVQCVGWLTAPGMLWVTVCSASCNSGWRSTLSSPPPPPALCALQSEPRDYVCNALGARMSAASATTLTVGVLLTLVSVVYSAFRAGSNTQTFRCVADWEPSTAR